MTGKRICAGPDCNMDIGHMSVKAIYCKVCRKIINKIRARKRYHDQKTGPVVQEAQRNYQRDRSDDPVHKAKARERSRRWYAKKKIENPKWYTDRLKKDRERRKNGKATISA